MSDFETIRKAIRHTTGENGRAAMFPGVITATVRGSTVIEEEVIKVSLTVHHNRVDVGIFWEEHGYKNYKSMGLFGLMNSDYQDFVDTGNNTFKIVGDTYEISINYNGARSSFLP